MDTWWTRLRPTTRQWLIDNNGDVVPDPIREEIAAAGGPAGSDAWWVNEDGPRMPDDAVDWIDETANQEPPGG